MGGWRMEMYFVKEDGSFTAESVHISDMPNEVNKFLSENLHGIVYYRGFIACYAKCFNVKKGVRRIERIPAYPHNIEVYRLLNED